VGTTFISQNVLRTTFISQNVLRTTFISQNVLRTTFINQNVLRTTFIRQNVLRTTFVSQNVLRTTFISQNVLRTTLLLSPLKANCLRFSTTVRDMQFTLILFLCLFWTNVQSKRTTRAEPEDHLWSADHSLGNADLALLRPRPPPYLQIFRSLPLTPQPPQSNKYGIILQPTSLTCTESINTNVLL
jgi:hypothetical protein